MAGIADCPAAAGRLSRLGGLMDIGRSCHTTFSIGNRQSAMKKMTSWIRHPSLDQPKLQQLGTASLDTVSTQSDMPCW
jgi:hypothetical protein